MISIEDVRSHEQEFAPDWLKGLIDASLPSSRMIFRIFSPYSYRRIERGFSQKVFEEPSFLKRTALRVERLAAILWRSPLFRLSIAFCLAQVASCYSWDLVSAVSSAFAERAILPFISAPTSLWGQAAQHTVSAVNWLARQKILASTYSLWAFHALGRYLGKQGMGGNLLSAAMFPIETFYFPFNWTLETSLKIAEKIEEQLLQREQRLFCSDADYA